MLSFLNKPVVSEDIIVEDKCNHVPGAVDKREERDSFTLRKGDVVKVKGKKCVVLSLHPFKVKEQITGKIKVIKSSKKINLVSPPSSLVKTVFCMSKIYGFKNSKEFNNFISILNIKTPILKRTASCLNKNFYLKASYSPLKIGDSVITSEDLVSGKDLEFPNVRKEVMEIDNKNNKIILKSQEKGQQLTLPLDRVSNLNTKTLKKILKAFYQKWDSVFDGKNIAFDRLKVDGDHNYAFVVDSFKSEPEKLKELVNKSVYSGLIPQGRTNFRKGDKLFYNPSGQICIFQGYDRTGTDTGSFISYAWVRFGRDDERVRVPLANVDFAKNIKSSDEDFKRSLARSIFVYLRDNEKPIRDRFEASWEANLGNLIASYIDQNSLFSGINYPSVLSYVKKYAAEEYNNVYSQLVKNLLRLGYNKASNEPSLVTSKVKSLVSDKELVFLDEGKEAYNIPFKDVWSIEEDGDNTDERFIKFSN